MLHFHSVNKHFDKMLLFEAPIEFNSITLKSHNLDLGVCT